MMLEGMSVLFFMSSKGRLRPCLVPRLFWPQYTLKSV